MRNMKVVYPVLTLSGLLGCVCTVNLILRLYLAAVEKSRGGGGGGGGGGPTFLQSLGRRPGYEVSVL